MNIIKAFLGTLFLIGCGSAEDAQIQFKANKQYTFYTDLHLYSIYMDANMHILPTNRQQVLSENAYGLGDIFEVKNAEPNQCNNMQRDYDNYKILFAGRYVNGNHEKTTLTSDLVIDGHILLTHGDYPMDGAAKSDEFRTSSVRCKGSSLIQKALANINTPISATDAQNMSNYAKNFAGVDMIVSGHRHPAVKYDQVINGIRVVVLPRGKTILY